MKQVPHHRRSRSKAFTLVELLVVIAIVASLAALVTSVSMKMYGKAKLVTKTSNYKQIYTAHESYAADHGWSVCPAKAIIDGKEQLWTIILTPYLSDQRNKEEVFIDPFWKDYDPEQAFNTGIGMAFKHKLPESNDRNVFWNADDDGGSTMKQSQITEQEYRILLGDSKKWQLIPSLADTTRHKDGKKGMFLLFDGRVVFYTAEEAELGLTDPAKLYETE